jgi:MFS family permease
MVQTGAICISSILAQIADIFSQYSATTIQFLATCPSIVIIIMSLLSGKIAEFIPKKYLTLFSSSMFIVTAFGGFFFHDSLIILFVWEIILGMAIGILVPIGSSLIADYFTGEERSSMMGTQSAVISVGGVILSLLGGLLATIQWYYNYLAFLLIIPGFILLIVGLPLDKPVHIVDKNSKRITVTPRIVILYGAVSFVFMLLFNAIPTNLAMHLKEHNVIGSVNAGIASAVLMLSGAIAGLLFRVLTRLIGDRVIVFGFLNLALGSFITAIAESYGFILIGVFIAGFSLSVIMAQVVLSVAEKEKPTVVTMSIAIIMAINNLGAFLSPYFTKISRVVMGDNKVASRYMLVSILALAAALLIFPLLRPNKMKQ